MEYLRVLQERERVLSFRHTESPTTRQFQTGPLCRDQLLTLLGMSLGLGEMLQKNFAMHDFLADYVLMRGLPDILPIRGRPS
ncbi:MAG TPA: hypothetical protein VM692_17360 [Gammaproteobacteria bacterium]|nr:hypothetical protein [Gammaproteobacteria bacterium]